MKHVVFYILVNTDSGYGLLPDSMKQLHVYLNECWLIIS